MPATSRKQAPTTSVTIRYDLFDLPTAQHKAGLAGMLLLIRDRERRAAKDRRVSADTIPEIVDLTQTSATVTLTEKSVQGLMDDMYMAQTVEVRVKAKWPGQPPKAEELIEERDENGKVRKVKVFVYEVTEPTGLFLQARLRDEKKAWIKLWRKMLWAIPRGIPKTRIPFEQRAQGKPCAEGAGAWQDLLRVERARSENEFYTAPVVGALWLGAQATNAELIPFEGRAEHNLLLHFWPLTVLIFVPEQVQPDGEVAFVGYVLAIPEVSDLSAFLEDYPQMLGQLGPEVRGYRPAEAVIDLPAQGALAFLEHLARLSGQKATQKAKYAIASIDYLHLAKFGNNVKALAAGRIAPRPSLLENYQAIVGRPGEAPPFRNPFFRRGLMLALLNDQEWYEPMAQSLLEMPWPLFVRSDRSPPKLPWFWQDAAKKFEDIAKAQDAEQKEHDEMSEFLTEKADESLTVPLPLLIHRLVQAYVLRKTEEKSKMKWEDFKNNKIKDERTGKERVAIPDVYREAKEKVASGTFLEMRSRRDQAFVQHFTWTFCSVKQYLPEEQFETVARALLTQPDNVKTLTLLALSANS